MSPGLLRAFVAIELPKHISVKLATLISSWRDSAFIHIDLVDPDAIHLTLKFLGAITPGRVPKISAALDSAIRNQSFFYVLIRGFGVLPSPAAPRVLCAWAQGYSEHLTRLHQAVEQAAQGLGFSRELRPFTPHITLGRIRRLLAKEERQRVGTSLSQLSIPEELLVPVKGVSLMLSSPTPHGVRYSRLHLARLNSGE